MSDNVVLNAEKRTEHGKGAARKLRASGRIPAVIYGREMETVHVSLDAHEASHLFHSISIENTIIDVTLSGEEPMPSLVREVQTHAYRPVIEHVDFYRIQKGVAVEVNVPVHLQGVPAGVRLEGGILDQILHDLNIRSIPSKIPESIEVDVTELDIGDSIHVSDLTFGEGVEVVTDLERTVCVVSMPKAEVIEEEEIEEGVEVEGDEAPAEADAAEESAAEESEEG